jgi:hypothetical protein
MDQHWKPYQLATIQLPTSVRRRIVEVISYPFDDSPNAEIKIRMVPTQPTTLETTNISKLQRLTWKAKYIHIAVAQGMFDFPEDMLRYDWAFLVDWEQPEQDYRPDKPVYIYRLTESKKQDWTYDRWNSFSWTVTNRQIIDIKKAQIA